jgi:hypothetical protein
MNLDPIFISIEIYPIDEVGVKRVTNEVKVYFE